MAGKREQVVSETDDGGPPVLDGMPAASTTTAERSTDDDAVVVPAIRSASSLACVRSLGREGIRPIAVSASDRKPCLRSNYCSEHEFVPSPTDDLWGYAEALLGMAKRPDVRTIVPLREPDIYVLSKYRSQFGEHVTTPWPSFETVRTAQDRRRLVDVADDVGVEAPDSKLLTEWNDWSETRVIKPRYSLSVDDDGSIHPSAVEFTTPGTPPDVDAIISRMGHEPIVQEVVPGDGEYGFFGLFDEGTPIATFQHQRVRSYKYCGGVSVFRKSVKNQSLRRAGMAMLDALDWHGPAMVEFKRDPQTGEFTLLEINPRFWGSLTLPVHAGVNFPHLYYRLAVDDTPSERPMYDEGVGCHMLRGEMVHVHSLLTETYEHAQRPSVVRELSRLATSLVTESNFDYLAVDDPRPFVRDVINTVSHLHLDRF